VTAASATFSSGRLPIVNFTSLQCYGLILVLKTLRKLSLNMNAASAVLAKYEAFNSYPMKKKGIKLPNLFYHAFGPQ
jgi:hypothetical protein